ncbi:hypothetical protein T492DRAFT_974026 [Pavlovales sp. CCMP2436]|nr:hypothetical protein T492DRAFT_974026 [Pavlovales sp. CCMP2436]
MAVRPWSRAGGRLVLNQKCLYWTHADALARVDAPPLFKREGQAQTVKDAASVLGGLGALGWRQTAGASASLPLALALPAQLSAYGSLPELSCRLLAAVLSLSAESPQSELAAVHSALSLLRQCTAYDCWPHEEGGGGGDGGGGGRSEGGTGGVGSNGANGTSGGGDGILSHAAGVACWLNLYHCLMAHALLTFGAPLGGRHFGALHRSSVYALADGTFSPSDLEHTVLRARLCRPRVGWVLQQLLQQSHSPVAPSLAALGASLSSLASLSAPSAGGVGEAGAGEGADPRINFALASGEPTCVDAGRRLVTLPKVVEWYQADFTSSSHPAEAARAVAALLPADSPTRAAMEEVLGARPKPTVRFAAYSWACHARLREWQ